MITGLYTIDLYQLVWESFEACFHKSVRPLLIVSAFMIVFTAGLCRIGGFIGCSFIMERNMVDDYYLVGHVFANFSAAGATECYKTCQTNCRCISFNFLKSINQNNCQLNEENRHTKPGALKPMNGSQYYDLVTDYKVTTAGSSCPCTQCSNNCCRDQPCLNGATCLENCEATGKRFVCNCDPEFTGQLCQTVVERCLVSLGMETKGIREGQIRASSEYSASNIASSGRLRLPRTWISQVNDINQWLQIDLMTNLYVSVTRVATQGRYDWDEWVIKYHLLYSSDTVNFQYYRDQGQSEDKVFSGNSDRHSVVQHDLNPVIKQRYIRFRPLTWKGRIAMRVELYGCRDCFEALGMESNAISDVQITGSTEVNSNYAPPLGRLHLLPAVRGLCGAWAAAGGDTNPWLQIDLIKQNTKVNGIATQGRHDVSHWVTKYSLLYSNDSLAWLYYKEQGVKKDFTGNTDRLTVVPHDLNPPITTRVIRFQVLTWYSWYAMRVELYGCHVTWAGCKAKAESLYGCQNCMEALGMESYAITDSQIGASSEYNGIYPAVRGRLHLKTVPGWRGDAWVAHPGDSTPWLQIDLIKQRIKTVRVATQGRHDSPQWVTKYSLSYSNDTSHFLFYKEQGQSANKEFSGNTDRRTVVSHDLSPTITARYIRFLVLAWNAWPSMKVELYGCHDCRRALGMKSGEIANAQINASSELNRIHAAILGRLESRVVGDKRGSWVAPHEDLSPWLQIDLLRQDTKITLIATQGRYDTAQWVTKYSLLYSNNTSDFIYYKEQGQQNANKEFAGNTDSHTVVSHFLDPPVTARYVRFQALAWYRWAAMRVEVYGCHDN
ncbi:uncharacterized protein [Pocillopora verrucosa]|uniref:uncharacterized protein n=1 Tax=Pocillopora verrucosa TaxID=203993 RepID=UPI00334278B5